MGCFGSRVEVEPRPEQRWDAISLRDFKSSSWWTALAYGYLHFDIVLSLAVYGVDTFTAVNLLAFNRWSSSIEPTTLLQFDYLKWIFAACIIASFVNLGFEHLRCFKVRRRGNVAECYLDNLAVRVESARWGEGQGWRRFLVFAELTKSKKGAEYVALFTYFSFQSWIRVIICSGPRQVVNAFTLYAIFTSDLIPTDVSSVGSTLGGFFDKLGTLYRENNQQAVILSGMIFTLVIWVFSVLFLIIGVTFYVFFLWHYIPKQDGGLRGYCERKINKRLMRIVSTKVNKAIEKEERRQRQAELRAAKKTGEMPAPGRQATLPQLMDPNSGDKLPEMPMVNRSDTMTTLPAYSSRPGTPNSFELSALEQKRPAPSRQGTTATTMSINSTSSRAPLIGSAAGMGYGRAASPAPSLPNLDMNNYPPARPGTAGSNRNFGGPPPLSRAPTNGSGFGGPPPPLSRVPTNGSGFGGPPPLSRAPTNGSGFGGPTRTASPAVYSPEDALPSMPEPVRSPGPAPSPYGRPLPRQVNQLSGRAGPPGRPGYDGQGDGRYSPAPSMYSNQSAPASNGSNYNGPAYSPVRSATNPVPPPSGQYFPPQRNMTAPMPQRYPDEYMQRPGTAVSQRSMGRPEYGYDADPEAQRRYPRY